MRNKYYLSICTRQVFILITGLFVILQSCDQKKKSEFSDGNLKDSLENRLVVLNDSLNNAWEEMIEDDNEKLQFMKRLLNEVTYVSNYDEKQYDYLNRMIDSLKIIRYDRESMVQSSKIDQYDSATNVVTRLVTNFAYDSPIFEESVMMKDLIKDIHQKNGMVLLYRVHYDVFAEEINAIIEKHSDIIEEFDGDYTKIPLFKIPPEEV